MNNKRKFFAGVVKVANMFVNMFNRDQFSTGPRFLEPSVRKVINCNSLPYLVTPNMYVILHHLDTPIRLCYDMSSYNSLYQVISDIYV